MYKAKDENAEYEKELTKRLAKLKKSREKYMDMYTDDLISREELNEKIDKSHYLFTNKMLVALILPFIALYNGGAAIFWVQGNSEIPMRVSIMVNIINVGGNVNPESERRTRTGQILYKETDGRYLCRNLGIQCADNSGAAVCICTSKYAAGSGRCADDDVDFHRIKVGVSNRIKLRPREICRLGCLWRLGSHGH